MWVLYLHYFPWVTKHTPVAREQFDAPPRGSDFLSKGAEIRDVGSIHWEEKTGLGVVKKERKKKTAHI